MVVTSSLRTLRVVTVQYIDNRIGISGVKSEEEAERDGFKVASVCSKYYQGWDIHCRLKNIH